MATENVDIRPLNKILAASTSGCLLRLGLLLSGRVEESPDSAVGIGTADTSEIIKAKSIAMRPALGQIFE